ncbi:helix-turn-helix domain-containing protein [Mucilaginibacter paludis]|uniref:Transcriptional regulator, AraC family n=1 Tax=Mucilaginibacter paludis DSM 18603 TaxID=714943 RepID=H1Y330_9SPHI|nr:AraC family transcriptional regulator [Mucilaginibacter paludis]EHQ28848.1 transcriptional regulator, AraC family [Mucilaginibacter paludis DSM 18603]
MPSTIPHDIPIKNKLETGLVLKVSLMKEVIKPTTPHRHADYHELIWLREGSGYHEIDEVNFEVQAPVAFYLRPGQTHRWNFSSIPKGYVILFKEELLKKDDIDLLYNLPAQVPVADESLLFIILAAFYAEYKAKVPELEIHTAYLHFLIAKLRQYAANGASIPIKGIHDIFQQYKRLVNSHFLEQKQPAFYAGLLHITTAALNEACKKAVAKTASAIINERVLLEGKVFLSGTAKPIGEIAGILQFSDSPHFIKFFKHHTNLTPGAYRQLAMAKK